MIIIKFLIGLLLGWIAGSIAIIVLIVLRFGIPECNFWIKNGQEVEASKLLRKRYSYSLIIWLPIISLMTFLCYRFLNEGFYGYVISWAFMILVGFSSTGRTQNNLIEFNNSLNNCKDIVNKK